MDQEQLPLPRSPERKALDMGALVQDEGENEASQWLVTYADMVTLLMAFFVMLVAISQLDTERFQGVVDSLKQTLYSSPGSGGSRGPYEADLGMKVGFTQVTGDQQEPLLQDLQSMVKKKDLEDAVKVVRQGNQVILRVQGRVLFTAASADLNQDARLVLSDIAEVIRSYPDYRLDVKGHTDPRPVSGDLIKNNWDLSALRATAVLRFLVEQGVNPRRLTATGYADTDPLAPNTSPENMAMNRRVEFVLEKKEEGKH